MISGFCAAPINLIASRICLRLPSTGGLVARQVQLDVPIGNDAGLLHILGDVDQDRAGAAGPCDMERLLEHIHQVVDIRHQVVMLGDRLRDAGHVGFLEGIAADESRRDLAGDRHDRRRVHHRVGQRRHQVGRARSAGRDAHAELATARCAGIAFGGVSGGLFVAHQHVVDLIFRQGMVERHDRAARIAKDHVNAFAHQCFTHDLRPGSHVRHNFLRNWMMV